MMQVVMVVAASTVHCPGTVAGRVRPRKISWVSIYYQRQVRIFPCVTHGWQGG